MVKDMGHRVPLFRAAALLVAVLHLTLQTAAVLADGLAESRNTRAAAHVESEPSKSCLRIHQTECLVCQHFGTRFVPPDVAPRAAWRETATTNLEPQPIVVVATRSPLPALPRAPPIS